MYTKIDLSKATVTLTIQPYLGPRHDKDIIRAEIICPESDTQSKIAAEFLFTQGKVFTFGDIPLTAFHFGVDVLRDNQIISPALVAKSCITIGRKSEGAWVFDQEAAKTTLQKKFGDLLNEIPEDKIDSLRSIFTELLAHATNSHDKRCWTERIYNSIFHLPKTSAGGTPFSLLLGIDSTAWEWINDVGDYPSSQIYIITDMLNYIIACFNKEEEVSEKSDPFPVEKDPKWLERRSQAEASGVKAVQDMKTRVLAHPPVEFSGANNSCVICKSTESWGVSGNLQVISKKGEDPLFTRFTVRLCRKHLEEIRSNTLVFLGSMDEIRSMFLLPKSALDKFYDIVMVSSNADFLMVDTCTFYALMERLKSL